MAKKMIYCDNGHIYDSKEFEKCPFCYGKDANKMVGVTMPAIVGNGVRDKEMDDLERTASSNDSFYEWGESEYTVGKSMKETGLDPVVGWLVAIDGAVKGTDYRIHGDNNFIGRSRNMSICIQGDETISKENHAIISYEARNRRFYFTPGTGRNIVRVNDEAIFTTTQLKLYDIIELGMTRFIFIPFCGEEFDWGQTLVQEGGEP